MRCNEDPAYGLGGRNPWNTYVNPTVSDLHMGVVKAPVCNCI